MSMERDENGREVYSTLVGVPDGWYVDKDLGLWRVKDGTARQADHCGTVEFGSSTPDTQGYGPFVRAPVPKPL